MNVERSVVACGMFYMSGKCLTFRLYESFGISTPNRTPAPLNFNRPTKILKGSVWLCVATGASRYGLSTDTNICGTARDVFIIIL